MIDCSWKWNGRSDWGWDLERREDLGSGSWDFTLYAGRLELTISREVRPRSGLGRLAPEERPAAD